MDLMRSVKNLRILVTGGAGFIGRTVVHQLVLNLGAKVINVDRLTYAGNLESLAELVDHPNYLFERLDINNAKELERCFREYRPDAVIHLAAESHVDRSIVDPEEFIQTNIVGTYNLLEVSRSYWCQLDDSKKKIFRFHHVSTDEVYGDLKLDEPAFTELTPYDPSSPYSASKASSDHLVRAWYRTYGLPVLVTNCSNNYGPYQFPEKFIPLMILNALEYKPLPVYGKGDNVRDWLYVDDHARGICAVLANGQIGRTYNIGGQSEKTNIEVVRSICAQLDQLVPSSKGPYDRLIQFVADRPGHDRRYAIDISRIKRELGWLPLETFETGIAKTVSWYVNNLIWVESLRSGEYRRWMELNYSGRGVVE